jgi:hypothetical protein
MFLSFRRSQHALLALSFFVVMVLVVFSTLLYVEFLTPRFMHAKITYLDISLSEEHGTPLSKYFWILMVNQVNSL